MPDLHDELPNLVNIKTLIVTRRTTDTYVCLEGHPEIWGCGITYYEALGRMVSSHQEYLGLRIKRVQQS
jgi:hypothetical protein